MYLDDSLTQEELDEANAEIRLNNAPASVRWDFYWAGGDVECPTQKELDAEMGS